MPDSTRKLSSRRRFFAPPISLTPAATVLYLLTFMLAVYQLDRQNYQSSKRELVNQHFYEIFSLPDLKLHELATGSLYAPTEAARQRHRRELQDLFQEILASPVSMYELTLIGPGGVVVHAADPGKPARLRTLTNTLVLPNFSSIVDRRVSPPGVPAADRAQTGGRLILRYTTPQDFAPIEALTLRYWIYITALAGVWAMGYAFLYIRILRPMRRVTARLAESQEAPPRLIEVPQVLLESNYNKMAAQALLQILEERLGTLLRPAEAGGAPKGDVVSQALASLRDWFGIYDIQAAELVGDRETLSVFAAYAPPDAPPATAADLLTRALAFPTLDTQPDQPPPTSAAQSELLISPEGRLSYIGHLAPESRLVIFGRLPSSAAEASPSAASWVEVIRQACEKLRRALIAHRALEQDVFRQKSEANIVLSRNLGHDLTNIIATTKLDLVAVRRLLDGIAADNTGPRMELLRQSVHGILESTRFLQEIVNIYRSFSHVKRPQYERRNLNDLVEEFLKAFEPSVSSRVRICRRLSNELPHPIIEPRLLKLALFNVITNALDAHKRAPRPGVGEPDGSTAGAGASTPVVTVTTSYDEEGQLFLVGVEDNGPGIRDQEGRLLDPVEIDTIFRHGYSTKSVEASEGLGLSWVRTIVEQFHCGRVRAENLPQGGARITLAIRSMETAEAKVPQGKTAPAAEK